MPVSLPPEGPTSLLPPLTREQVDAARTSAWHERFEDITAPAVIINLDELGERDAFLKWIDDDGIFLPEGSEGTQAPAPSTSRPRSSSVTSTSSTSAPIYHLPKLNAAIRAAIAQYGAVFPKLNWTAPRDAAFLLPQGHGPLHCTSPADIYLLLKSSDFVAHSLDARAYEDTDAATFLADAEAAAASGSGTKGGAAHDTVAPIELVLKKFQEMNPAREVRCFVRDGTLLAITQRDSNYYEHLQSQEAQEELIQTVREFWEDEVRENYEQGRDDYVFDLYLDGKDKVEIVDFEPYRASTDALLFTYEELQQLLEESRSRSRRRQNSAGDPINDTTTATSPAAPAASPAASPRTSTSAPRLPVLRVIDSAAHPAASAPVPTFSTNMMPLEMLQMSDGRTLAEFAQAWDSAMRASGEASDSDDEEG